MAAQRPGTSSEGARAGSTGTTVGGRYRLTRPLVPDLPGAEPWSATDTILDRPVRVDLITGPRTSAALDAARRAALVTEPRLNRILQVTQDGDLGVVVTSEVEGRTLADLAAAGPLAPDQARAIVGEVAGALEEARRRGLHHLALRPRAVTIDPTGRVIVRGLAVDGALIGLADTRAHAASRRDAIDLTRLLYAALTGRWPAPPTTTGAVPTFAEWSGPGAPTSAEPDPGLPAAPAVDSAAVPPAELVSSVPADLDTLCAVTLGPHEDGPHSPGEVVRELEPWRPVHARELFRAADSGGWAPVTRAAGAAGAAGATIAAGDGAGAVAAGATAWMPDAAPNASPESPAPTTQPEWTWPGTAVTPDASNSAPAAPAWPAMKATPEAPADATVPAEPAEPAEPSSPLDSALPDVPEASDTRKTSDGPEPSIEPDTTPEPTAAVPTSAPVPDDAPAPTPPTADSPAAPESSTDATDPAAATVDAVDPADAAIPDDAPAESDAAPAGSSTSETTSEPSTTETPTVAPSTPPSGDGDVRTPPTGTATPERSTPDESTSAPSAPPTGSTMTDDQQKSTPDDGTATPATPPVSPARQSVRASFTEGEGAGARRPGTPPPAIPPRTPVRQSVTRATGAAGAAGAATAGAAAGAAAASTSAGPEASSTGSAAPKSDWTAPPRTATRSLGTISAPTPGSPTPAAVPSGTGGGSGNGADTTGTPDWGLPFDAESKKPPRQPRNQFDPTRWVLGLVGVGLVVVLVIAIGNVTRPWGEGRDEQVAAVPTSEATAAPSEQESAPAEEDQPAAPAVVPTIAGVTTIDPSDADGEKEELIPRIWDGDPATAWYTHTYNRPDFAGFKNAVGIAITLAEPATVSSVTLEVNGSGGNVEVRATDAANPTAGEVLASGALNGHTVLTLSQPTETQSIVLWFTSLAQTPDGKNRIEISELTVG